jgi:hypothetical protein
VRNVVCDYNLDSWKIVLLALGDISIDLAIVKWWWNQVKTG